MYAAFHDDSGSACSMCFASREVALDFAAKVALCKYLSTCNPLAVQEGQLTHLDAVDGEGDSIPVQQGDTLGVRYIGWLINFHEHLIDSQFDSNVDSPKVFRFTIGEHKVVRGILIIFFLILISSILHFLTNFLYLFYIFAKTCYFNLVIRT